MKLSVIICSYDPAESILNKVLFSLRSQSLPSENWELILVDNNSSNALKNRIDISWHSDSKVILESKTGLSYARLTGVNHACHPLIVFVDDDNILDKDYLKHALKFYEENPNVGCFGGKSIPIFETMPPDWFFKTGINLGCQDYGDNLYISDFKKTGFKISKYPDMAPIGTGMVISKDAFLAYVDNVQNSADRLSLGRKGLELSSGEDNDIILTIIKKGYEIAYVPALIVNHVIPSRRYSVGYLRKMAFESSRTWIKVLTIHQICQWKKINKRSYFARKAKSYIKNGAWGSPVSLIKWEGACGIFKGLAEL